MSFVQLDRRFRKIGPHLDSEQESQDSYLSAFIDSDSSLSWADLLAQPIVVILGEPGSGKSEELENSALSIKASGEFAFYVPLERLAGESLDRILGPEDLASLRRWKASRVLATFFLDSVDEAKLRMAADFLTALKRFQSEISRDRLPL